RRKIMLWRIGKLRAALAERGLGPEDVADLPDLLADLGPLLGLRGEQGLQALQLLAQLLVLAADLHLLKLAQRPQAHVEDGFGLHLAELEGLHQDRPR